MRRVARLLSVLGVLAGLAGLAGCSSGADAVDPSAGGRQGFVPQDGTTSEYPPGKRRPAPAVTGELLRGGSFDLAGLRGQVVVLNFWGSWCAPCRVEAPTLRDVNQATKDQAVAFVGVNIRDQRDSARAFEDNFALGFPSVFDPASRIALALREFSATAIPSTVLVDRAGRIAVVLRRALVRTDELEPVVRRLAAEPA